MYRALVRALSLILLAIVSTAVEGCVDTSGTTGSLVAAKTASAEEELAGANLRSVSGALAKAMADDRVRRYIG